ncbi:glycosyltransferase family 4 protein [Halogeometricum limi]|uniref:Glycosyltransferase involved in cell wall bisynthesis n=1 Tax=Halogeometricum limi TaxID=555875 RepID=A0A1I6GGJ9_9EURY|nr:glycosyltransferase family 4 protein [Halogeometricum limi]SFR41334.1 Glycosyltransferase involved in cell wall bisynthesis [Halogeometricum limi]
MHVGLVTPRYPPTMRGGGEVSVQLLAEHLDRHDAVSDVTVFSFDARREDVVNGVTVRRLGSPPHVLPELGNLYAAAAFEFTETGLDDIDLLHAYNMALNPVVGYLSDRYDVPSVATLNSYDILPKRTFNVEPNRLRRLYERLAFPTTGRVIRAYTRRIDRFVTLSEASKRVYCENGFDPESFVVVPNMVDPDFEPLERREANDCDGYSVLYVGSLIKEKGVDVLVRAVARLPEDVTLRIVGDGDERERIESVVTALDLEDRVTLEGRVPYERVKRYYASSDLFVHPGVWPEPFGRTLLEAMESGLPVVATDVGGPAEIVTDPAFRAEPGDSEALAAAIERAREAGPSVGEANRASVAERFSPEAVLEQMLSVYDEATAEHDQ